MNDGGKEIESKYEIEVSSKRGREGEFTKKTGDFGKRNSHPWLPKVRQVGFPTRDRSNLNWKFVVVGEVNNRPTGKGGKW